MGASGDFKRVCGMEKVWMEKFEVVIDVLKLTTNV
jgi:hypothetical protein